jgi:hypothetical protein
MYTVRRSRRCWCGLWDKHRWRPRFTRWSGCDAAPAGRYLRHKSRRRVHQLCPTRLGESGECRCPLRPAKNAGSHPARAHHNALLSRRPHANSSAAASTNRQHANGRRRKKRAKALWSSPGTGWRWLHAPAVLCFLPACTAAWSIWPD